MSVREFLLVLNLLPLRYCKVLFSREIQTPEKFTTSLAAKKHRIRSRGRNFTGRALVYVMASKKKRKKRQREERKEVPTCHHLKKVRGERFEIRRTNVERTDWKRDGALELKNGGQVNMPLNQTQAAWLRTLPTLGLSLYSSLSRLSCSSPLVESRPSVNTSSFHTQTHRR